MVQSFVGVIWCEANIGKKGCELLGESARLTIATKILEGKRFGAPICWTASVVRTATL
jgi:hypothetical protein